MEKNSRFAFTMVEVVFVIVILGILAAIAIPRLAATRDDAEMAKGRSDVAAIRAAIVNERQARLLTGEATYIGALDDATTAEGQELFEGNTTSGQILLTYPIVSKNSDGHWRKSATNEYKFKVMNTDTTFTYNSTTGRFDCTAGTGYCNELTR